MSAPDRRDNELLDVEGDDEREARLRDLLHRANSTASASFPSGPSPLDFGIRETHSVQPPSELLERLQQFLPQMEAANAQLAQRARDDPESVDIEHLDHSAHGPYIEMNLGLGVFDMRQRGSGSARTRSHSAETSSDDSSASEDDATDTDSQDSAISGSSIEDEHHVLNNVSTQRPTRPLPKRSRPSIVVLEDHETPPAPTN